MIPSVVVAVRRELDPRDILVRLGVAGVEFTALSCAEACSVAPGATSVRKQARACYFLPKMSLAASLIFSPACFMWPLAWSP